MKIQTSYFVQVENEETEQTIAKIKFVGIFDKKAITECFIQQCKQSKPGYVIEYWKQDQKYAYNPMLTVENHNGELKRLIIKGNKCYYKAFDVQNLINSI